MIKRMVCLFCIFLILNTQLIAGVGPIKRTGRSSYSVNNESIDEEKVKQILLGCGNEDIISTLNDSEKLLLTGKIVKPVGLISVVTGVSPANCPTSVLATVLYAPVKSSHAS